MKIIKRLLVIFVAVVLLSCFLCIVVSAEETVPTALESLISNGTAVLANQQSTVSSALDVIAYQNQMAIAGISGNPLTFSAERFMCAMNISSIESILGFI